MSLRSLSFPFPSSHFATAPLFSCLLFWALALTTSDVAVAQFGVGDADDDVIVIVDDDSPPESDDDIIIIIDDDGDELLIIEDDDDAALIIVDDDDTDSEISLPRIQGALGGLWEAWHVAFDSELSLGVQPVDLVDGPIRGLARLHLESWILPAPNLSLFADGFARIAIDTNGTSVFPLAFVDIYEAYAKINLGVGAVQIGRLVLPWGRTQVAALGDLLNPMDHRRGPSFVDAVRGKQPQFGVTVRSSLGEVSFEAVALVAYEPTQGSLAASDQGGVRPNRYQSALVRSPARVAGLFDGDDRIAISAAVDPLKTLTFGMRGRRRVIDIDVGLSVVWGMDETPSLDLDPSVAKFLAREAFGLQGVTSTNLPQNPCVISTAACVGPRAIFHQRTATAVLNLEWGLGVVILKSEFLAQPNLDFLGVPGVRGKTTILVTDDGLQSRGLSHFAAAIAAEAGLYEWVTGSLEVFDRAWVGVPAGQPIWGVEILDQNPLDERIVHRLAIGADLHGSLLDNTVSWQVRGEGGVLQPDLLGHVQILYSLPAFDLYVGVRGQVFVGVPGSPGWLRQDASSFTLFFGEGR